MKARFSYPLSILTAIGLFSAGVIAQTTVTPSVVSITAPDPIASEEGPSTGLFVISRSGASSQALTVLLSVGGSAVAGVDYHSLPSSVTIPKGSLHTSLLLVPIDDSILETNETVVISIRPPSTANAYTLGDSTSATVTILDNDAESATLPTVSLAATVSQVQENATDPGMFTVARLGDTTQPLVVNYQVVNASVSAPSISTKAVPAAKSGVRYEALSGQLTIATGASSANIPVKPINDAIYEGTENVTIRLTEQKGYHINAPSSATVFILDDEVRPPNKPPVVAIVKPLDGSQVTAPGSVEVRAEASDSDGSVSRVDFFVNGQAIGSRTATPYTVVWANTAVGSFQLTAVATDNEGLSSTSAPVAIQAVAIKPFVYLYLKEQSSINEASTGSLPVTILRTGSTDQPLTVALQIGGTASNGVDYLSISNSITIAPGQTTTNIYVKPINDSLPEGNETVTIAIVTNAAYRTGFPSNVVVTIVDDDLHSSVKITTPTVGSSFTAPAQILIQGTAQFVDGYASEVAFFAGDRQIGESSIPAAPSGSVANLQFTWNNVAAGTYSLTARVTSNRGTRLTSDPVKITVGPTTVTNHPPSVQIVSPAKGASFSAPANVTLIAQAADADAASGDYVATVAFYSGTTLLGITTNNPASAGPVNPFQYSWANVSAGSYSVSAVATDTRGASTKSEPVTFTVTNANTGSLPVVSIAATDLFAFEVDTNNTGQFQVSRTGSIASELQVFYEISGTASNGVDYLTLPGVVVIPANQSSALITVTAIADTIVEGNEHVILTLIDPACSGQSPPPAGCYTLGVSQSATVGIVDTPDLPPIPGAASVSTGASVSALQVTPGSSAYVNLVPGAGAIVSIVSPAGTQVVVESSDDLAQWTPRNVLTNDTGIAYFVDEDAAATTGRFYRVTVTSGAASR